MREGTDMRARWRGLWHDLTERVHPAVLLGGGVLLVFLLFGALSLGILAVEGGLDDLGLRPRGDVPEASGDDGADGGEPGSTDLARGLAVDGDPPGESRDGAGGPAAGTPAGADGGSAGDGADAATRSTSAPDAGDAAPGSADGDASPGTSTPPTTTGSAAPGTTQPPTTSPPTTGSSDGSSGDGLLGGLLDLLGLRAGLSLG